MKSKGTSNDGKRALRKAGTKGFTLVELIVILVILAILAALLVPALTGYIQRTRQQAAIAECRSCVVAGQSILAPRYAHNHFATLTEADSAEILELADVPGSAATAFPEYVPGGFEVNAGVLQHFCYFNGRYYVVYCSEGGCANCGNTGVFTVSTTRPYRNPFGAVADRNDTANTGLIGQIAATGLTNNQAYSDTSAQAETIKATFLAAGVDLDALTGGTGTWTLRWNGATNEYNKVYWTTQDLSGSGQCYVMAFTLKTQNFTVWKANYSNGKITGEIGNSQKVPNGEQTYENALEYYNQYK